MDSRSDGSVSFSGTAQYRLGALPLLPDRAGRPRDVNVVLDVPLVRRDQSNLC
jgi:hypothetical protein